jgi:Tol biopolymer transport system component
MLDTGNTELLAHVPGLVSWYDLSPDGRTIYYAGFGKLMQFDIASRRERELRNTGDREFESIALSPDAKQLAITFIGGAIEIMPSDGGQPREVSRPDGEDLNTGFLKQALGWTPDQRYLLFVRGDGNLYAVPAAGGEARKLGISMGLMKSLAVHPDGKQFVFSAPVSPKPADGKLWALENLLPKPK